MPHSTGSKSRILRLIFTAELVSRFAFPARAMYPPMAAELLSFLLSCTEITLKKCESKNTMRIITYKHRELQLVLLSFLLPHSPKHVLHVLPQILVSPGPTPVDTHREIFCGRVEIRGFCCHKHSRSKLLWKCSLSGRGFCGPWTVTVLRPSILAANFSVFSHRSI